MAEPISCEDTLSGPRGWTARGWAGSPPNGRPEGSSYRRLAGAWADALAVYCLIVLLLGVARLAADIGWAAMISREDEGPFCRLMGLHAALALACGVSGRILHHTRRRTLWALRLIALATPLVLLLSADRICAYYLPLNNKRSCLLMGDEELDWRYRPGSQGRWDGTPIVINSKGLRGPEVPYDKAPGEFRILFLGDSIPFGYGVAYEDCFVARVQRLLDARNSGRRCTTIACAVLGYSPWQEAILLKREGMKYHPDLVVQCFCANDAMDKFGLVRYGGTWLGWEGSQVTSPLDWSGIYRLTVFVHIRRESAGNQNHPYRRLADVKVADLFRSPDSPKVQEAWRETDKDMQDIISLCREDGISVAVIYFPCRRQLSRGSNNSRPQGELASFCSRLGVPFLDLLPLMKARAIEERGAPELMEDGLHPTVLGHQRDAEQIVQFLRERRLVPEFLSGGG